LRRSMSLTPPLMEVVSKLIDTEEALVNRFDYDAKHDAGTSNATGDSISKFRKRSSEVLAVDGRRPLTLNVDATRCSTAPACSTRGALTPFANASSSRGRSARPRSRSDPEVTATGHTHITTTTTTTTAATIDVAAETTIAVTTGYVITAAGGPPRRARPSSPTGDRQPQRPIPVGQEVNQYDCWRPEV
jgi:hypothetical protein